MTEATQGLGLDLAYPLSSEADLLPYLLQGVTALTIQPET